MTDVQVVEVAARDGLQNDPAELSAEVKAELISRVAAAGIRRAEVASFVSPKAVPKMADAEEVLGLVPRPAGSSWIGLVLNERGFQRAATAGVDEVNLVVICSETFSQRNQGMSIDASIATVEQVVPLARSAGITPTVTLGAAFGCPFEGPVPADRVQSIAERCLAAGISELALADTIGAAVPSEVRSLVAKTQRVVDSTRATLRAHFHNTRNTGYANALAAAEAGVRVLDSSLGGIGGCPFAPKATGNIATEDLVHLLERSGFSTGLDLTALLEASAWLGEQVGRRLPSLVAAAGPFPSAA